jgi:C4-dicarboxylate-specific signal transduction histidine kinase
MESLKNSYRSADKDQKKEVFLGDILEDVRFLCEIQAQKSSVKLEIENNFSKIKINCRPIQMTQVLQNLISNAIDIVSLQSERWVKVSCSVKEGQLIEIYVVDSGAGVPQGFEEKIFSALFTDKPNGMGTGMGLSISKRYCESHGGYLKLIKSSNPTTFVVGLPLNPDVNSEHRL